jgi:plasmid maintenance system antidote protein VapI
MTMQLQQLIEQAAANAGTATALAKQLGVSPQRITEWKNGHRPCPLHSQAQIAELAGIDPKEWVWGQICKQLGRVASAAVLALATCFAVFGAPGVAGDQGLSPA